MSCGEVERCLTALMAVMRSFRGSRSQALSNPEVIGHARSLGPLELTNYDGPRGKRLSDPCICLSHLTEEQQDIDYTLARLRLSDRTVLENREQGGREWVKNALAHKHPAKIVSRSWRLFEHELLTT